jgi:hypothetical protein
MFDSCNRQYYYQYIGSLNVSYGHELKSLKYLIEDMSIFKYFLGNIVHKAIELQLKQITRGREVQGFGSAINYIDRVIDETKENQKRHIIEALNGKTYSDKEIDEIGKEAKRQVNIFFNEFFNFYKDLEIIELEDYTNFVIDGYKFYIKPDLVTRSNDGRVYITDWKTDSNFKGAVNPNQMNSYILWALTEGFSNLENLRAEFIFLDSGKSVDYKVSEEKLEDYKVEIIDNSKKLYESIDCKSCKEDFEKCEKKEICISCGYNQYCKLN